MVTKVYSRLESLETAMMEEKLVVTVVGYPELTSQTATIKMFKAFANMTVYLTTNHRFSVDIILD